MKFESVTGTCVRIMDNGIRVFECQTELLHLKIVYARSQANIGDIREFLYMGKR
jgi:hypothetical protein